MYSGSINAWNRVQKHRMLWWQVRIWGTAGTLAAVAGFSGTVTYVHSISHHLRLAAGDDNRVEIFHGKQGWPDPFGQQRFYGETAVEPGD
ncbi:MAG: hypothetical protein R3E89_15945 [Thiolinea sp.]